MENRIVTLRVFGSRNKLDERSRAVSHKSVAKGRIARIIVHRNDVALSLVLLCWQKLCWGSLLPIFRVISENFRNRVYSIYGSLKHKIWRRRASRGQRNTKRMIRSKKGENKEHTSRCSLSFMRQKLFTFDAQKYSRILRPLLPRLYSNNFPS